MKINFSLSGNSRVRALVLGVALAAMSAPALAADKWLACDGTVETKKGTAAATSAPVKDIYAYNDDVKTLYKYAPKSKALAPLATTTYDAKAITWANLGQVTGMLNSHWEGKIDRATMALTIKRVDGDETVTWKQTCKPTSAQPQS